MDQEAVLQQKLYPIRKSSLDYMPTINVAEGRVSANN